MAHVVALRATYVAENARGAVEYLSAALRGGVTRVTHVTRFPTALRLGKIKAVFVLRHRMCVFLHGERSWKMRHMRHTARVG